MNKYKEVYNNIKKQIKDGKLKPKDYLKKEADFSIPMKKQSNNRGMER